MDDFPTPGDVVRQFGLNADKRLGQHYLLDRNITDKIARLAEPLSGKTVVEIGPGPGGLTQSLLRTPLSRLVAIEMDDRFIEPLHALAQHASGRLEIRHDDATRVDLNTVSNVPFSIAANLPYNIGTLLLINWLQYDPLRWDKAVLMFQKEVAERIVAAPKSAHYGRLAILCQSVCDCQMAFEVPARAFSPPPKVDSAVVLLTPYPKNQQFSNLKVLGELTAAAFGQRRKMLRRSLKPLAKKYNLEIETWLGAQDIDPTRRPETLSVSEFQSLALTILARLN